MKALPALREGFSMRFNAGNSSLWYSDWRGFGLLCNEVDFVHTSDTQLFLRDIWNARNWWLDRLSTCILDNVKQSLLSFAAPRTPNTNIPDYWVRDAKQDGAFSASSSYKWLLERYRNWDPSLNWDWALPINLLRHIRGLASSPLCQRCLV